MNSYQLASVLLSFLFNSDPVSLSAALKSVVIVFFIRRGRKMWFIDDRAVGRKLLVIRLDTRERDQTALSTELKSINSAFELVDAL
jgi:hypothetical protein